MNIKKFDTISYYNTLTSFTSIQKLESGVLCKTKDYELKNINYIIPNEAYTILEDMINSFIESKSEFKFNEIESLISNYTFSIYKKRVAAKKIAFIFLNLKVLNNEISTENGFNFLHTKKL